jgi:hypothetical protein
MISWLWLIPAFLAGVLVAALVIRTLTIRAMMGGLRW